MTRLVLVPEDEAGDDAARHVPTINWYENFKMRPLKVGGRLSGKGSE